jgi:hypothetical protein
MKKAAFFSTMLIVAAISAIATVVAAPLMARVHAQSVAQSYIADSPLQPGMIVEQADDKTRVKPVTQADTSKILGIVIRPNDATLSLSEESAGQSVYVATTGTYHLLASDQNGPIKKGDYVVVSAIAGVGMKVNDNSEYVVGKALDNFDGKTEVLSTTTVKDSKGVDRTVNFGFVTVTLNISRNPLLKVGTPTVPTNVPSFLQKASNSVANRPVTSIRVYASLAVLILIAIIVCTVLYAAIRTSITALGRNPLARKSIFRNLFSVVLIALIILITGLFAVYLLLKL